MKNAFGFLLLLSFGSTPQLFATSIIPFKNLGEVAKYSDAVVMADAVEQFEIAAGDAVFYRWHFRVKDGAKGGLPPGHILSVQQASHRVGDWKVDIAGDFVPEEGATYLLFLHRSGDVWKPVAMSYYVFQVKKSGDEELFVPIEESLSFVVMPRPDGVTPEPLGVYHIPGLLQVLEQYAKGSTHIWDATSALSGLAPSDFLQERVLPTGCDFNLGSGLSRWQDAAVNVYYDDTGTPSGFDATLDVILGEMNTEYSGIDPFNTGIVSYTPSCASGTAQSGNFLSFLDGLNGSQSTLIIFDDPCGQIANLSSCEGTLAIGGSYSSSSTHTYKGDTWFNAAYGFVIVNNGTPDCLTSTEYEFMMTHELTHTYRMDHLDAGDFPDQNMNPLCCNAINDKDMECMNYTYDIAAPVEIVAFDAQPYSQHRARVTWATASESNNDFFTLEHSADGLRFELAKTMNGNNSLSGSNYEWIDPSPHAGLNYYRLHQTDFNGRTSHLGIRSVRIGGHEASVRVSPNPLNGAVMTLLTDLPDAFQGFLEITDMSGKIVATQQLALERGRNKVQQPVQHIAPGIYFLRLLGANDVWTVRFLKN